MNEVALRLTDQSPVPRSFGLYQKICDSEISEQGSKFESKSIAAGHSIQQFSKDPNRRDTP